MGEVRKIKKITPIEKILGVRKNPDDIEYVLKSKKSNQGENFKDYLDKANEELDRQEMDLEAARREMYGKDIGHIYRMLSKFNSGIDVEKLVKSIKEEAEEEKKKEQNRVETKEEQR